MHNICAIFILIWKGGGMANVKLYKKPIMVNVRMEEEIVKLIKKNYPNITKFINDAIKEKIENETRKK